jgi:cytosine/adenosine deaminase-related metal-dependent hydrolase
MIRTPLTFINADMGVGSVDTLRVAGGYISSVGGSPQAGDRVIDLRGDRLLPGLINAHDHLQLNSLRPLNFDRRYAHVRDWIADINALRRTDDDFEASIAVSRDERLLIGGVKNLLSGVTTVAHHDPLYPSLVDPDFPTRVVTAYGWSHSLYIDGEARVRAAYRETPADRPWIIHAAEGINAEAANEFERLEALGCLGPNTLIVHGIALDAGQRLRLAAAGAGLIWCPSSNLRLFGRSAEVHELIARGLVGLGTDSRLSGDTDLLEELHVAAELGGIDARTLEAIATRVGARLLRLPDRGRLEAGALADLLILPRGASVSNVTRSEVCLVMLGGRFRYGDGAYARAVDPGADFIDVRVDGREKVLDLRIADLLAAAAANEPGVDLPNAVRPIAAATAGKSSRPSGPP